MNICIIGAGLGGLSAALALLQKGFCVTVLEQASALGEIGAGVQLGPNAVGVLYRLGLQTALEQVTCETLGKRVRLWNTGQTWPLFDLGTVSREMYGYPYLTVHRADLHRVLVDAVRALQADAIVLHAKLQGLQASSDGVALHLTDGRVFQADAVIGADGVHSMVRAALFGDDAPRESGVMAWRGVIDASKLPAHMREPYGTNWVGPGAHVVQYPLRQGALMNFVGAIEGTHWTVESWSERGTREECLADFADWHEEVQAMIQADLAFHRAIYQASGNPLIAQSIDLHWHHLKRVMGAVLQSSFQRQTVWDEHEAIANAIAAGEADVAVRLVQEHAHAASVQLTARLTEQLSTIHTGA
jgi:salicylate hydroxylase